MYGKLKLEEIPQHCLWECTHAQIIWQWIASIVQLMLQYNSKIVLLSIEQALLSEKLSYHELLLYRW